MSETQAPYELSGPAFLTSQPVTDFKDTKPGDDWDTIFPILEQRREALRNWRWSWWAHWGELARSFLPRRYHWLVTANVMDRGYAINNSIIDNVATISARVCYTGLWSGLTSATRPWFKMGIGLPWIELDAEGKAWLEDTEQRLYYVLGQSNFYNAMGQMFEDVTVFGTSPVLIYEDMENVIRCDVPCAGEYFLGVGSQLTVDTFYREFNLTVLGIVDMFGVDNCPIEVVSAWNEGGGQLEREFIVCMAIEPNFDIANKGWKGGSVTVVEGGYPYREVYWLKGIKGNKELFRRGYDGKPFFVARWSVTSNDAYGRGPGMDALGDTRQLQLQTRREGELIEKLVRPAMGAHPSLKNEPASILPAHITYVDSAQGKPGFWPLYEMNPAALGPMTESMKRTSERIEKTFFVDVFMAITNMEGVQPRNDLEITKRDLERLQQLGPFIARFETECAEPALKRVLDIMTKHKLIKPMPPSLKGIPLKIEFNSMMKQAQSAAVNTAIAGVIAQAIQISEAAVQLGIHPPIDVINLDLALRTMAENVGFPNKSLHDDKAVDAARNARSQHQQAQQTAQLGPAAVQAAQQLSQTNTQSGALGQMLGQGNGSVPK